MAEPAPQVDHAAFLARLDKQVATLPPLPEALRAVWQVLERDELSIDHCVRLIEQDAALAARTLRIANSAFYGMPGRVARIGDAVNLLGLRAMASMLAAVSLTRALQPAASSGLSLQAYTRHAVATAVAARALAPRLGADPEQAFLTGLMHDIGQLVLATHFPAEAAQVRSRAQAADQPSFEAERAVFGLDHADIGARLARHWRFPPALADGMAHHHRPADPLPADAADLATLVHVADAVAHALDLAGDPDEAVPALEPTSWIRLGLDDDAALALLAKVERDALAMLAALA